MKIIIGLGNPGNKYRLNRHNVGFRCIDLLADKYSIKVKKNWCESDTGKGEIAGNEVFLAKPRTFVNLSGHAAACLLSKLNCAPQDLLVIHDDLDLPTGRLRIRMGGKSGGHRGIRSIIDQLGEEGFYRMRIGISRPSRETSSTYYEDEIVDYVLGNLSLQEEQLMQPAIDRACEAAECILSEGITVAMNKFNRL
ncbi:MAG: aminoacyl-tRNA hydrolase [Dehalococcoidia bacterium]|nr:aminoacyl-tRNA hydrolase [Dehalococcoidia bacterium]